MLIFMKIYVAEHGDGRYLPEEDVEILRIARQVGLSHGMDEPAIIGAAKAMKNWYDDNKATGDRALLTRFRLAMERVDAYIQADADCRRTVRDYLLDVARADEHITPGETDIVGMVEAAWNLEPAGTARSAPP